MRRDLLANSRVFGFIGAIELLEQRANARPPIFQRLANREHAADAVGLLRDRGVGGGLRRRARRQSQRERRQQADCYQAGSQHGAATITTSGGRDKHADGGGAMYYY